MNKAEVKSKLRGHDIVFEDDEWLYVDTKTPTVNNERDCGFCGKSDTSDGHDGGLGELPDVMNACCGHGVVDEAYIQYWDESCIRGEEALEKMGIDADDSVVKF